MTSTRTENREVCIVKPGEPTQEWREWRHCPTTDPLETTAIMALRRYLRDAGFETRNPPPFEPFTLTVCVAPPSAPRHANGRPMTCHAFDMRIGPTP